MKKQKREISSFDDLHKMSLSHANDFYIYRGEDDSRYLLRPKFGRYNASTRTDALSSERGALAEFKRRGVPHIAQQPADDWEWLALAQHFGLATRFLDWTKNPLVAAFFATSNLQKPTDRVIYALKESSVEIPSEDTTPFDIDKVNLYSPKHLSARISAQLGLFTVHPNPAAVFESETLERWVIKESAVIDLGITLDSFGFNQETMFPGLDGLAFHINDWFTRGIRKESA